MNHDEEYNSLEFVNFYENHKIKRQLIVAYTLQQNDVFEKKYYPIMNMM